MYKACITTWDNMMGLDLTLKMDIIPYAKRHFDFLLSNRLRLDRNYDLFDAIKKLPSYDLSEYTLSDYWDEGIREISEDPYGEKLRYIYSHDLAKIEIENISDWNKAVLMLFKHLEANIKIILYWS